MYLLKDANGQSNDVGSSKVEDMLEEVLKSVKSTNSGIKELKGDISNINELVDSHSTSVKQLEHQLDQMSTCHDPTYRIMVYLL